MKHTDKIKPEEIVEFIKEHPNATMFDIAKHFNCLTVPTANNKIRVAVWNCVHAKLLQVDGEFKFNSIENV